MSRHSKPVVPEDSDALSDFSADSQTISGHPDEPVIEKEKKKRGRQKKEPPPPREKKVIEVRGGKLKDIFCHYEYDHNLSPTVTNGNSVESEVPCHPDLIAAFKKFEPHLAIIFGDINQDYHEGADANKLGERDPIRLALQNWKVTKFKLVEYGDEEGIIISGSIDMVTGNAPLNTPIITFLNSKYDLADELRVVTNEVIFEIEEYLHGRKKAADNQLKMEFNHEEAL